MNAQKCGKFITELRKDKNLTQKDLANELNVSDKAISRWETGKGFPDVDSLQSLSKFFSVSINELLAGEKAETKTMEQIAEENIISAMVETEKIKNTKKSTIILSIIVALILLIPLLKGSIESIIDLLGKYTLVNDPWLIIFNLFISLCIFFTGLVVYKGHYKLLHSYHYRNVTDFNGYCHELGKEVMFMSLPLLISTIMELWVSIEIIALLSKLVLSIGFIICFIFIFKTQIKYNGGLF
ncbi:MAG: helix-turn-helix transcriptional regulator [Ruminococcaceae bacterium]|nr:helix-turn-helix transcriptional regulator [Oscillospiraceae bacterium]